MRVAKMIKENVLKYLNKGTRYDGRKPADYRDVTVEYGITKSAEGSARVKIGGTEVIAGVKMSVEKPYPDTPNKGNLMVSAELRPMANPRFEAGPPSDFSIELSRVTDRCIRESEALNVETLCITEGEAVWSVIIDIVPLNDEGNLFDAAALAAIAAIKDAKYPGITEDGKADYDNRTDKPVQLAHIPLSSTIYKIGKHLVVDPLEAEQDAADARLTVGVMENGTLCSLQKGGEGALTIDEVDQMVGLAMENVEMLRSKL
jgi:exosome complex component RRP42